MQISAHPATNSTFMHLTFSNFTFKLFFYVNVVAILLDSGCILCKAHTGGMSVASQVLPTLNFDIHLRCKDQKKHLLRFVFYYTSTPKSIV